MLLCGCLCAGSCVCTVVGLACVTSPFGVAPTPALRLVSRILDANREVGYHNREV